MVQGIETPARTNTFGDLANAFSEFLSDQILIKAKDTLHTGEMIMVRGFADETTAEASHGSDVSLLESSQEEADTRIVLHANSAWVWTFGHMVQTHRCSLNLNCVKRYGRKLALPNSDDLSLYITSSYQKLSEETSQHIMS